MPSELQQNRYDQLIRRVGGLVGPGSKVAEALTELFPVIDVERVPGELLMLGGTKLGMGGGTMVGIAGQAPKCQLFNPADSGFLVTLTTVWCTAINATILLWGTTSPALTGAAGTESFRDTRLVTPELPVGQVRTESSAVLASAANQQILAARQALELQDQNGVAVLAPGTGFEIGSSTLADTIFFSFFWRERIAEQSELNF